MLFLPVIPHENHFQKANQMWKMKKTKHNQIGALQNKPHIIHLFSFAYAYNVIVNMPPHCRAYVKYSMLQ